MKVRIVEPGWGGYCGPIAGVMFEDGVSAEITGRQAFQIASILRTEATEGEDIVAAANAEMAEVMEAPIEVIIRGEEEKKDDAPIVPAGMYTREDLESIADKKGINGLREIAEPMGVKGTSIAKLIDSILEYKG